MDALVFMVMQIIYISKYLISSKIFKVATEKYIFLKLCSNLKPKIQKFSIDNYNLGIPEKSVKLPSLSGKLYQISLMKKF